MMRESHEPARMEQEALMGCVYCPIIYPDLKRECPRCGGSGGGFRQARMMDRESSSRMILDIMDDTDLAYGRDVEKRERLISLLRDVVLYDFDLVSALALRIREMEEE